MNKQRMIMLAFLLSPMGLAMAGNIGDVANNLLGIVKNVHTLLHAVLIVSGAALCLGSIIKYQKYRQNPKAVPLSSSITMLVAGIVLIGMTYIPMVLKMM